MTASENELKRLYFVVGYCCVDIMLGGREGESDNQLDVGYDWFN